MSASVVSVIPSSIVSDAVTWDLTNNTNQPQLATCEIFLLNGSTQIGTYGPVQIPVAGGASAREFAQVDTLSGTTESDSAQIFCRKG